MGYNKPILSFNLNNDEIQASDIHDACSSEKSMIGQVLPRSVLVPQVEQVRETHTHTQKDGMLYVVCKMGQPKP